MKNSILSIWGLTALLFISADERNDDTKSERVDHVTYANSMEVKAWVYGGRLLQRLQGDERKLMEVEIAGAALSYFLLQEEDPARRRKVIDYHINRIFNSEGLVRNEVIRDPLGRHMPDIGRRGLIYRANSIRESEYEAVVERFKKFLSSLE